MTDILENDSDFIDVQRTLYNLPARFGLTFSKVLNDFKQLYNVIGDEQETLQHLINYYKDNNYGNREI